MGLGFDRLIQIYETKAIVLKRQKQTNKQPWRLKNISKKVHHPYQLGKCKSSKQLWDFILPQSEWQRLMEQPIANAGGDAGQRELSFTVDGIAIYAATMEISVETSQ